jgi:hypothetical protein
METLAKSAMGSQGSYTVASLAVSCLDTLLLHNEQYVYMCFD